MPELRVIPLDGIPEVSEGDDVAELVTRAVELEDDDVVVLAQKIVSKSEGRIVRLDEVDLRRERKSLRATRTRGAPKSSSASRIASCASVLRF